MHVLFYTKQFATVWHSVNRATHEQFFSIMRSSITAGVFKITVSHSHVTLWQQVLGGCKTEIWNLKETWGNPNRWAMTLCSVLTQYIKIQHSKGKVLCFRKPAINNNSVIKSQNSYWQQSYTVWKDTFTVYCYAVIIYWKLIEFWVILLQWCAEKHFSNEPTTKQKSLQLIV